MFWHCFVMIYGKFLKLGRTGEQFLDYSGAAAHVALSSWPETEDDCLTPPYKYTRPKHSDLFLVYCSWFTVARKSPKNNVLSTGRYETKKAGALQIIKFDEFSNYSKEKTTDLVHWESFLEVTKVAVLRNDYKLYKCIKVILGCQLCLRSSSPSSSRRIQQIQCKFSYFHAIYFQVYKSMLLWMLCRHPASLDGFNCTSFISGISGTQTRAGCAHPCSDPCAPPMDFHKNVGVDHFQSECLTHMYVISWSVVSSHSTLLHFILRNRFTTRAEIITINPSDGSRLKDSARYSLVDLLIRLQGESRLIGGDILLLCECPVSSLRLH